MKAALLLASGLLCLEQPAPVDEVPQAPAEFQSLEPLAVAVVFADVPTVNMACAQIIGVPAEPGSIYEACAGVGEPWMILRHGALYPDDKMGNVIQHETGHVRGWYHGRRA